MWFIYLFPVEHKGLRDWGSVWVGVGCVDKTPREYKGECAVRKIFCRTH